MKCSCRWLDSCYWLCNFSFCTQCLLLTKTLKRACLVAPGDVFVRWVIYNCNSYALLLPLGKPPTNYGKGMPCLLGILCHYLTILEIRMLWSVKFSRQGKRRLFVKNLLYTSAHAVLKKVQPILTAFMIGGSEGSLNS